MKSELINVRPDARKESNGCHGELEREEWRDVKGYEGYYQVSSFGRVRSVDRFIINQMGIPHSYKGMILQPIMDKGGYLVINLRKVGMCKMYKTHRLVAQAFIPNPDNLPQVNHRNENKTSNYPDNLEWCTAKYNMNYGNSYQIGLEKRRGIKRSEETKQRSKESKRHKMTPVLQYSLDNKFIAEFESTMEAERQTGVKNSHIGRCCKKEGRTAYGYIWRYKE